MPAHCWPTGIRRMIPFIFFSFKPYRNGGNDDAHQVAAFRTPGQVPTLRYNTCHYLALPTVYTSSKASIFSYRMQHWPVIWYRLTSRQKRNYAIHPRNTVK